MGSAAREQHRCIWMHNPIIAYPTHHDKPIKQSRIAFACINEAPKLHEALKVGDINQLPNRPRSLAKKRLKCPLVSPDK